LWLVDLVFQLRCRGARAEVVQSEIGELVARGLVRALAHRGYELTTGGWDRSRTL
jgi:hypothetical protein